MDFFICYGHLACNNCGQKQTIIQWHHLPCGDSRIQKVGGALQGQGKSMGANIMCFLHIFFVVLKIKLCGGQKMAPHVNKCSSLDGAHVTVIVTTSQLS